MEKITTVSVSGKKLKIKKCSGLSSLKGLMFDSLEKKDGALIHGNSVWMPFVKQELDLFFLDDLLRIVDIQKAVPMTLHPKTWTVYSSRKARYCLEVKAGLVKTEKGMNVKVME